MIKRLFCSARKPLLLTCVVALILLTPASFAVIANAKEKKSRFKPEEKSLRIFPSHVQSATWFNIETLTSQDLYEGSLFQSFSKENSAFIDPAGTLPEVTEFGFATESTITPALGKKPVTPKPKRPVTADDSNDASLSSNSHTEGDQGTSTTLFDENTEPVENLSQESTGVDTTPVTISEEGSLPDEEITPEPDSAEEVVEEAPQEPESTEASEPISFYDNSPLQSFFARVTNKFSLVFFSTSTSVEDTETSEADFTEVEELDLVDVVAFSTSTNDGPATTTVAVEDVVVPASTSTPVQFDDATSSEPVATATQSVIAPVISDVKESSSTASSTVAIENVQDKPPYSVSLWDFGVPDLESGQFVENLQLRLSLGGQYEVDASSSLPSIEVTYQFGDYAGQAGTILLDEENSNALNGGYYLIALPQITDPSLLSDLRVNLTFVGDVTKVKSLFIDSVWLEVGTVVFDAKMLKGRSSAEELLHLKRSRILEFIGEQSDFTRGELPHFNLRYKSQRNFVIRGLRNLIGENLAILESVQFLRSNSEGIALRPELNITKDGLISIVIPEKEKEKLKPGVYTVELTINEGGRIFTDTFDFQWGLLSINPNQTEYEKGQVANISMGALTPNGNTLCKANLDLYIIDPTGFISQTPVVESGYCDGNNVTDVPDYQALYLTGVPGIYEMYLERLDDSGNVISHTSDTFEVVYNQPVVIERVGPSRIYPPSPYAMELTVHGKGSGFSGELIERVPADFKIFNTDAVVRTVGDRQELVWDMSVLASTSKSVSYEFDAPDLSPYLYELGPAELIDDDVIAVSIPVEVSTTTASSSEPAVDESAPLESRVVFKEHRQWQIASDATGNMILFWDNPSVDAPTGWTCLSCGSGTFFQRFVVGSSTYNTTGGASSHTPSASGSVLASALAATEAAPPAGVIAPVAHTHTYSPTIGSGSNLPQFRDLRVIQYTDSAGEPPSIPAGAIGVFDVASSSLPSGWIRYSVQDGAYIQGGDVPGSTGGSNTHSHTISGSTGNSAGSGQRNRGGTTVDGATLPHTHTVTSNTGTLNNEPPYVEVLLAKLGSDATAPNNLISMWTDEVPTSWVDVSSNGGDAFNNKFIKPAATYGSTGGSNTHVHANVTGITSSAPVETNTQGRVGTAGSSNSHTHSVSVTNFSTSNHLPPYITAIFGKRQGINPVLAQNSFRWYVNTNAQTPTDPWPAGATDLLEAEALTEAVTLVKNDAVIRLRMNALVTNATATASTSSKLQFASTTVSCASISVWADVGTTASSTVWRGYDNTSVADQGTLVSLLLASSTISETYEENAYATSLPNQIPVGDYGEWDFVIEQNGAEAGTQYCFRLVNSDGSEFNSYDSYPSLITNFAPNAPVPTKLFDNEKTASTSPWFEFVSTDAESEDVNYQIQIDDNANFLSTVVDHNTTANGTLFENLVVPSDKDPFTSGELMRYKTNATLSNGTTYWWRVRARDPGGSNQWGDWMTARSFTIDTGLTASAWFQTTEDQFDTNTLSGLETPASNHVALISGSSTGVMTSSAIDFDDGSLGTAWGSFSFSESDSSGVINYQIQFLDESLTWTLIPDADLTGNSTGLTTTTSLLNLDTDTYNQIRILSNFTGSGGSPTVNDWTIEWDYRVETPTISKLFYNEKTGTTTPTFEFTTTDPQADSLTYQIAWSTDKTFTSSTTRTSDADLGFVNIDFGGDTDPFNSGDSIQYTVQPADALTNNTTYWWRVRAKDTTGDNAYSLWTTPQSFTVDNTVVVSTWFQTTEEQFDENILSGTIALSSDEVSVATTATEAMFVYGKGVETTPFYREWDGSSWTDEAALASVGAPIKWVVTKAGTTREEYVAATVGTDGDVNVQVFAVGQWDDLQEVTTSMGNVNARGFDVAYETISGDALVVYCDGDADPSYYVWNGSTWTAGATSTINLASTDNCEWIKLASDPVSDEIILLARDSVGTGAASYEAQVWDGDAWGDSTTQGGSRSSADEAMALAYEESGGQALIITGDGNPARFEYNSWNGSAWAGVATESSINDNIKWAQLVSDVGSDEMALCYVDESTDVGVIEWTGSAWTGQLEIEADANAFTDRPVSCVYETTTGRDGNIMVPYSDATNARFRVNDGVTPWVAEASVDTITDSATVQSIRTGDGTILAVFFDDVNDIVDFSAWDGSNWSTKETLVSDASVGTSPFGEPFMMAARKSGRDGTVIGAPGINFTDGVGPYWESMSWVDATPGASEALYSVQFFNTGANAWQFIPDIDLPGNAAGTSTSPIDLSNLSVSTYSLLRPYAAMSCDGSNNCPTLQDWTIEWAEGITISGTLQEYDQSTNVNSGTVAVAVNGVLQIGKTGSVAGGVWSIDNVTTFPDDVVTVFVSGAIDDEEAVGVTRYDGLGDITGLQLYQRHLSLGSDDLSASPLSNSDISIYDVTNDEDVFTDLLSGGTLDACATTGCGDVRLFINASTTFRPGGNVITHDLENNGTLTATTTLYISGSWDNNATTTLTSSTLIFQATSTTESIDNTGAFTTIFNNVVFGTTTGNAIWAASSSLDINGNLTVTRGTFNRGTQPITIAGNLLTSANGFWSGLGTTTFDGSGSSNWADQNATLQNVGRVVVNGTSKTVLLNGNVAAHSITIGSDDILDVSVLSFDITVYENWNNQNTFAARSGEVFFVATSSGKEITAGSDAFYDLTFTGVDGAWAFTEDDLLINRNLTIATGTVTLPIATTSISGSFDATGGSFSHSNGVLYFIGSGAKTITFDGTDFGNPANDMVFEGSGSWTLLDTNATTSGDVLVKQGSVTFPTGILAIGGALKDQGGSFAGNGGTVRFFSSAAEVLTAGGSSFSNVIMDGSGSWSFSDTNFTITEDLNVEDGTLTLPSGTLSLGGSYTNNSVVTPGTGTMLFNSTDTGETINLGGNALYNMVFNNATGGWTITDNATTTNNFTLTAVGDFTLASGQSLVVGGTFTNSVDGSLTTWDASTLSLGGGTFSINTKTNPGDRYETLLVKGSTHASMWNSSATTTTIIAGGSLYSQDHAAVDGDLYIYGAYERTSGTEYWSFATDFDGTDLSGGSERQVDVRMDSGATANFVSSTLNVTGTTAATTTVANQGSGTYTVALEGATSSLRYYDFIDLGATGLSLLASTTVASLRDGGFTVAAPGGTAITLASTTIAQNPAKQIFNVGFSTTTAIAATNVTQTDGTPDSYWWFRNSRGNLDGEAFDNDTGDPGSIRWDDSSLVISVSGVVFQADESTPQTTAECDGVLTSVRLVVSGTTYDTTCSAADGSFNFPAVTVTGDPVMTGFINSGGGAHGVTVSKTPTANISGFDIYRNRVIVRHEDTEPLTIADMAVYDSSDDSDIHFTAATGTYHTLVLEADHELHVWATTTFAPGGAVTLNSGGTGNSYDGSLHIGNDAVFTAFATTSIGGSFTLNSGAVFTPVSTTVLMTATTSGKALVTENAETLTLHELQFVGVGGAWNIAGNILATGDIEVATGTVTGTGDITLSNGSFYGAGLVSLGSGVTTIDNSNTLGGVQAWTFSDLVLGSGLVAGTTVPASNATTTISGTLTISTAHFLDAGSSKFNLSGSGTVFVENGTFLEDTSLVTYSGVAATNILSTNYYDLTLNSLAGAPTYTATGLGVQVLNDLVIASDNDTTVNFTTNDPALNVDGDMEIGPLGTFIASDSGAFTIGGSYLNNGTYTHSGGSLTFDGASVHTIAAGNSEFSTVVINGSGDFTMTENATATVFTLTAANDFTLSSGSALAVGGTFTNSIGGADTIWTDSTLHLYGGGNYEISNSSTNDSYGTLVVSGGTHIRMWNSDAATTTIGLIDSLYSMDHAAADGDLYIYGNYTKTTGTDYWSYATDFDGSSLSGIERQAFVYVAADSDIRYQGGSLQVLGDSTASTSITNQSSGRYSLTVAGASVASLRYYQIRDIDADGLTLSGAPTISTLSNGDFLVTGNGETAMTVGGTVINANPAKTFTGNSFATSSGVTSAFNVTATGTSVSSWRFTNHSGSIEGEDFDSDPDGDPGYLVWTDSAASITVSGRVYSDEGTSVSTVCDSSTANIHIRVEGLTSYTTSCNGDGVGGGTGAYSVSGIAYSPGNSIIVYIDGETEKAAAVTTDPVSSINDFDLYENRVIVRHENTDPITIHDMVLWDSSDDPDIPFTAASSTPDTLTLPADRKLIVWTNKEFQPDGDVTLSGGGAGGAHDGTLELLAGGDWTSQAGELHRIGGSLISGVGSVFDAATAGFIFTTTGAARVIDTNGVTFASTTFNGSGSWVVTDTVFGTDNLSILSGALTLPTGTTTIAGSLNTTSGSFDSNGGVVVFNSSGAETIRVSGSDFFALTFDGTGSFTMQDVNATTTASTTVSRGAVTLPSGSLIVGGDFANEGGTLVHNSGEIVFTSAGAASLLASSSDLFSVTFSGGGSYQMLDGSISLLGSLSVDAGSLLLASGTLSIGGSFDASGGTFDNATGTILFNSGDAGELINAGVSPFYNVVFANAAGGWTITANATTSNNFTLSTAANFTLDTGITLVVGGVFSNAVGGAATTWTGSTLSLQSGTEYAINTKTASGDTYGTLVVGPNTDISSWHSSASTAAIDASASWYSQDHAAADGSLFVYGDYHIGTTTEYWSYATDFDGTALSGGSERIVTVSHAAGATTTVDGGVLQMIGAVGNVTTVTNQGGATTYGFTVSAGTLNAQRYAFRNLASAGLTFSGTPSITSLNNGDFELAVGGGSLISLASSTLNANASLVITGARFATTTAISGVNVNLSGTTTSAWTFVSHTGNLSGEAFDNDGGDECGQIRWDNSSCLLTQQTHYRWRNDDGGIGVPADEWFDTDWDARQRVKIDNSNATTTTNAAIRLLVAYDSDMQADFDDLRFTDSSGTTSIPYFIASSTNSVSAEVWVQVPSLVVSDVSTVFMYYKNAIADTTSSSTAVFIAADDFEDGGITEYSGETSLFAVDGTFAYGGLDGLDNTGNESARADDGIARFDQTVSQGEIIRFQYYVDTSAGSSDEACTLFGVQSPVTSHLNYAVCLEQFGTDRVSLVENAVNTDSSGTILASSTITYVTGWHTVEIDWQTDGTIDVDVYNESGSLLANISASDSTKTSGGLGFTYWGNNGGWDNYTSRPRIDVEPTITFGVEQTDGGATWSDAEDTLTTSFSVGDIARLRIAVENTGLSISDAYQLEYAAQGVSPSCEAVPGGSYNAVEPYSTCGTDPVCMATSTTVANGANTSDLLLQPEGTFTLGRFVEDPSNTTASLTLEQNEYTEVEYALQFNNNVTDQNACFRVSDAGVSLDTYLRVAKASVRFDPTVGAVNFNDNSIISLLPSVTTRVYATTTITDKNGYADIILGSSTMFTTAAGAACSADNNNCYLSTTTSQCSFSNCSGNSCDLVCYSDIFYHADATDTDGGQQWFAFIEVEDTAGGYDFNTSSGIELMTLRAIDVLDELVYGSLAPETDTGSTNSSTTVVNVGNVPIDIEIDGTDLSDGLTSDIPAGQQKFASTTFTYSSCTVCASVPTTTPLTLEVDLGKPTVVSPPTSVKVYWGIAIPFGISSTVHQGSNTLTPVSD